MSADRTARDDALLLLKKGLRNPKAIPPFLAGQLFPDSRWGPDWRRENGFVTFKEGRFAGGSPSNAELCARVYHQVHGIRSALGERDYDRSLEVGCGYGRLSGWIADHAEASVAIEPNAVALEEAARQYPEVGFHVALAEAVPFADDAFDLVTSWMVLTHIAPESLAAAIEEFKRVAGPDATILLCERTRGERGRASWPRSVAEYEALFDPFELVEVVDRTAEPTWEYGELLDLLVFER